MPPTEREVEVTYHHWLRDQLHKAGVPIMAEVIDRGNRGVMVTAPDGKILTVYVTTPVHSFVPQA